MHPKSTAALALALLVGFTLAGAALAQSTGAPAGRAPATAPGGDEGIAGPSNEQQAIDSGEAVGIPPGTPVEQVDPRVAPVERVPPSRR